MIKMTAPLTAILALPFAAFAVDYDMKSIGKDLAIMSRVLEEGLENSDVKNWHEVRIGRSSFEPKIRAEYIPSVGALFTIDVNFPIVEHAGGEQASAEPEAETEDLWERFSRDGSARARSVQGDLYDVAGHLVSVTVEKDGKVLYEKRDTGEALGIVAPSGSELQHVQVAFGPFREFDEQRVARLKNSLIESMARYGHRLGSLRESDRILIVVSAPRAAASPEGFRWNVSLDQSPRVALGDSDLPILGTFIRGRAASPKVFTFDLDGDHNRDRLLLSFGKAAFSAAMTPDEAAAALEEIAY